MKATFAFVAPMAVFCVGVLLLAGNRQPLTQPQRFVSLGDLPGGSCDSVAYGISADGSVVVGHSNSAAGMEAFRWTPGGGIEGLGFAQAFTISSDGSTIVGYRNVVGGSEPVVWTPEGVHGLGMLAGFHKHCCGEALGVSADGSTVVGVYVTNWNQRDEAPFLWSRRDGLRCLDSSPDFHGQPRAVSADGAVIVGVIRHEHDRREAFRWTNETGVVGLGVLSGDAHSVAQAVSADGSVVVGWSESIGTQAFRWTEAAGIQSLGRLRGGSRNSRALAASADGSVIVGQCHGEAGMEAFVWDAEHGMRSLREVLINDYGLAAKLQNWKLLSATAVSADGTVVAGFGFNASGNREAWIASLGKRLCTDSAAPAPDDNRLASLR